MIAQMGIVNAENKDNTLSNVFQGESFNKAQSGNSLAKDLMQQINQNKARADMDKKNKLEQERIVNERDNKMRQ